MALAGDVQGKDTSSTRALQIPELSCIIFDLVGKQHAARLGCTSRALFRSFMPLAWEHVSCATRVFNLIPSARIFCDRDEKKIVRVAASCLRVIFTFSCRHYPTQLATTTLFG